MYSYWVEIILQKVIETCIIVYCERNSFGLRQGHIICLGNGHVPCFYIVLHLIFVR